MLIGREKEFTQIETLILNSIKNGTPLSIYISGPPGTGKTATVKAVIAKYLQPKQRNKKFSFISLDCFASFTATSLAKEILSELGTPSNRNHAMLLEEEFKRRKTPIIILLDEVDKLLSCKGKIISMAFNWPSKHPGRVIVIGISNTFDLTKRQISKDSLQMAPHSIVFPAYTNSQLLDILKVHLANKNIEEKAVELCARKVSAMTGDVRRAFDIASQVLENMREDDEDEQRLHEKENIEETTLLRTPQKTGTNKTPVKSASNNNITPVLKRPHPDEIGQVTPKKSACREVLSAINKTMSSPCQRSTLPLHPRILLAILMQLISTNSKSITNHSVFRTPTRTPTRCKTDSADTLSVSRDRLFQAYIHVCERNARKPLESDELNSAYGVLESQAIIRLSNTKAEGQKVSLMVEMSVARQAINANNDDPLFASIENLEL